MSKLTKEREAEITRALTTANTHIDLDKASDLLEEIYELRWKLGAARAALEHYSSAGVHGPMIAVRTLDKIQNEKPQDDYTRVLREDAENP